MKYPWSTHASTTLLPSWSNVQYWPFKFVSLWVSEILNHVLLDVQMKSISWIILPCHIYHKRAFHMTWWYFRINWEIIILCINLDWLIWVNELNLRFAIFVGSNWKPMRVAFSSVSRYGHSSQWNVTLFMAGCESWWRHQIEIFSA